MKIFWIKIHKLKYKNFFKEITKLNNQNIIFTPNPEILIESLKDNNLKKCLNKANYLTSDWIGLFLAYQILEYKNKFISILLFPYFIFNILFRKKYLYKKFWDRICGSDLTKDILIFAEKNDIKISVIDIYRPHDKQKVLSQKHFKANLKKIFPDLKIDYFIYKNEDKKKIIKKIWDNNSQILFSTLWMKIQEESIIEITKKCNNIKLGIWVWSSFDYMIWFQKRAPKIFRKLWFEWLYRLVTWPQKLKRINRLYNAIVKFSFLVFIKSND